MSDHDFYVKRLLVCQNSFSSVKSQHKNYQFKIIQMVIFSSQKYLKYLNILNLKGLVIPSSHIFTVVSVLFSIYLLTLV